MEHDPHGMCITETWLDDDISDSELFIPGYVTVRLDRSRHGGGIIMYTLNLCSHTMCCLLAIPTLNVSLSPLN